MPPPEYLPFNRKERFFTATVLPGIIASCDLRYLDRFLILCGLDPAVIGDPEEFPSTVQFLTEYGFAESVSHDLSGRWDGYSGARDTPDLVIVGPNWIVVIEAKMYANQSAASLEQQTAVQRALLDFWSQILGIEEENAKLVYLLPGDYADGLPNLTPPVVTWEEVLEAYRDSCATYWLDVLEEAIRRYPDLVSNATTTSWDAMLSGREICRRFRDGTLDHRWIGRRGGRNGQDFQRDCSTGDCLIRRYRVRLHAPEPPGTNWWPIAEFVEDCCGPD